jgi:hypothetical protein
VQPRSPKWTGESNIQRRATGYQSSECMDVKALSCEPTRRCVERVIMESASKDVFEASSGTTCQMADRQAQKGTVSDHAVPLCMVSIRMKPGVKHPPKITENDCSERIASPVSSGNNPPMALSSGSRRPGRMPWWKGWLKKQRPHGNIRIC